MILAFQTLGLVSWTTVFFIEFHVREIPWFVGMQLDESKIILSTHSPSSSLFPRVSRLRMTWYVVGGKGKEGHVVHSGVLKGGWCLSRLA